VPRVGASELTGVGGAPSRGHDLSRWAQHVLQDDTLAAGLAEVETSPITTNDLDSTRHRLLRTIEHRYIE
jgi:hypothetical protein